jgi:hypothetical protein
MTTTLKISINNVIGISFIDSYPKELISITIQNLILSQTKINDNEDKPDHANSTIQHYDLSWERTNIFFSVDSIVINNQLHDCQFPVILARNRKYTNNLPFIYINYLSVRNLM